MPGLRPIAAACILAAAACATAGTGSKPRASAPADSLSSLAWMAGSWTGTVDGVEMEEHWSDAKGGLMLGSHRDLSGGRLVFFEQLLAQARPEGTFLVARPKGLESTAFKLERQELQRVVFENPAHDFPQRVIYWRENDLLTARVEGMENGAPSASQWTWRAKR